MNEIKFGGKPVSFPQEYREGYRIELDEDLTQLSLNLYERKRNEFGEVYDYDITESYELGDVQDYFFDSYDHLRSKEDVARRLFRDVFYGLGLGVINEEITIDTLVDELYDNIELG